MKIKSSNSKSGMSKNASIDTSKKPVNQSASSASKRSKMKMQSSTKGKY